LSRKPLTYKEVNPACGIAVKDEEVLIVQSTGDIRAEKPVFNHEKCTKCKLCVTFCPEGCIIEDDKGEISASMTFCKGCGICAYECPAKAIEMEAEKEG
jgi:pyruvate ferredoxin oxidoreductase delta subunit